MIALAWRNLIHDRTRFAVTVLGIAFAVFLMTFQSGLLVGFTRAASRVIDSYDADVWIMPRGVPCFDFAATLEERTRELALGVEGVADAGRIATGYTVFQKPNGFRQTVLLQGVDDRFVGGVPHVSEGLRRESTRIDETDALLLVSGKTPADVEINGHRGRVSSTAIGFASFLGAPYVFTGYHDAVDFLRVPAEQAMFILIKAKPGVGRERLRDRLRVRFPNYDVWTSEEFSIRARKYWLIQTGAGGALSLSALLGFVIGLVIVSQTTYATTMENLEEYATLKALGASRGFVRAVVLIQALCCGVCGAALGFLAVHPMVALARSVVTWVFVPNWMFAVVSVITFLMCALASVLGVRAAIRVEPGRVFRA
jgi:putative ABC transport system permease protein